MRRFILNIRNKRLKGNVSLLVILILLASSVITLLSISQIQHLITYWNLTFNYFRAFYLAKAWTELGLTEVYNRENGFQDKIENKVKEDGSVEFDDIITRNFLWDDKKYEWAKPYFNMEIKSRYSKITDDIRDETCKGNEIVLKKWEWIVLSLFIDNTSGIKRILDPNNPKIDPYKGTLSFENINLNWKNITLWGLTYKKDDMSYINVQNTPGNLVSFMKNIKFGDKQYLTIKNPGISSDDVKFCIKEVYGKEIPYSHYLIDVQWHYGDLEVWLQSVVKKDIPSWALNVLGL